MSRTSFTRKFSFNSARKNSRESKQHPHSSRDASSSGGGGGGAGGGVGGVGGLHQHHHSSITSTHNYPHHPNPGHQSHPHPPHPHHHNSLQDKRQHSRRENSDAEKVARGIFGDVPLTDSERRFLSAADTGHLSALEQCVEENGNLNVNCRDYLGRTALQLAVLGEHYDCISYLLEKSSMDTIEEALLHAIKTENVKICDMVLCHPMYSDKSARMQLEFQHGFYDQEDNSSSFSPDITPIVLAAQCNNFDIVHMLIQKGFTIQRPHHYFCYCTECSNHKTFDRFVHSRSRLNAYRGLASTAYLSLSCDDPFLAAFELSKSLQTLAETEKEYKNEYRSLSESCKSYAVDLLDLCRSNEEVMAALHGGFDTRDLSRIRMAIRYEQKKFIAHASCQEHLMSMWYAGVPWFQHQPFTAKLFLLPLGIMFIPVTAIVYVFLPYSKVGEVLRSPFMKFVNYICSYTAFLTLLFFATTLTSTSIDLFAGTEGVVNSLIMFYVLGMFWAECKQLWEEGVRGYFSQMWNYMDITMLALYTASYAIEGVIYTKVTLLHSRIPESKGDISMGGEDDNIPDPQILARVLFSVANVMSFARIAYILPASETFGQLQISYGRMLQDVGKFIFIYFTVMIAFICGLTSLYSLSAKYNKNFANLIQTTGTLFWAAFGMGTSAAPTVNVNAAGRHSMVELVGYILYGVYILGAVVVLINMLIAMMSNTFEEIQKCEDIEWKFARAKLWISFIEEGTTLPIPFNIVPTPKSILRFAAYVKNILLGCSNAAFVPDDPDGGFTTDYKVIMHKVVLRYVHKMKFEKKGDNLKEDLLDAKEETMSQTYNMFSALHMRIDCIERQLYSLSHTNSSSRSNTYDANSSNHYPAYHGAIPSVSCGATTMPHTAGVPSNSNHLSGSSSNNNGIPKTSVAITSSSPLPSRRSPSPTTQGGGRHRAVTISQSVPGQDPARLGTGFFEPRREFVSRRWSYYDRSRTRGGSGGNRTLQHEYQQQQQHPQQQHLQRQRQYSQGPRRGDHSPARQQPRDRSASDAPARRSSGGKGGDYSPVRYQEKGDYSPVRLHESGSGSGSGGGAGVKEGELVALSSPEGNEVKLRRQSTMQRNRHQTLRRQNSVQQPRVVSQPTSPQFHTEDSQPRQPLGLRPSSASPSHSLPPPLSPHPSPQSSTAGGLLYHLQAQPLSSTAAGGGGGGASSDPIDLLADMTPILRPDLTPTHSKTLRRVYSRTERRMAGGGGRGGSRSPSLAPLGGGRSDDGERAGGIFARRITTPGASPTASSSSKQPSPQRHPPQQQQEMAVLSGLADRHSRTQSLHRDSARPGGSPGSRSTILTSQGSKEI